jgi:hypothetical protein
MQKHFNIIVFFVVFFKIYAQDTPKQYSVDVNYYYGSILPHSEKISHLITEHPEGIFVSAQEKTFGNEEWESRMNYPDFGLTFHYQNNKNETLGDLYGLYAHYNFYFLKRNLQFRIGQGVAYNTNPYDKEENYRNSAFGSHFMPASFFMLNYQKDNIWEGLGLRSGLFLIHHSNGTIKTPNTSANTVGANLGVSYTFDHKNERTYHPRLNRDSAYTEPIRYNLAFRSGVHESHIIGSGQHPFYVISAYADKRFTRSSSVQFGLDVFLSMMLKHEIEMMAISFPEKGIDADTDYKRMGLFLGYELFLNRLSFEAQLGAYVYDDYKSHTALYQHLGLKYYFYRNFFLGTGLKTHFSKAEAMDFSLGVRL